MEETKPRMRLFLERLRVCISDPRRHLDGRSSQFCFRVDPDFCMTVVRFKLTSKDRHFSASNLQYPLRRVRTNRLSP